MLTVFGLLNLDAPHGIPFIVVVLPLFRKLLQSAGVILRQLDFFQQLLAEMGSVSYTHLVAQGNQIFMNDVFLKRLTAPTITSGGNPPAFRCV